MRYIRIYLACLKTAYSRAAAYRSNFILGNLMTLFSNVLIPLVTVLVYSNGASFPGWDIWQALLIQSVFAMSAGAASMLWGGILWSTMGHVQEGSFETVLLRPLPPLFYLAALEFDPESGGLFLGGLTMTIICTVKTGAAEPVNILSAIFLFLAGLAVMGGLELSMAAISFKWVGNSRIPEIADSIKEFGKYPIQIFPRSVQCFASIIIPVAMIGFFPASALLGRLPAAAYISVIPCIIFFLFGIWLYDRMIKKYEGVGG